jgi:hypothetical protein
MQRSEEYGVGNWQLSAGRPVWNLQGYLSASALEKEKD